MISLNYSALTSKEEEALRSFLTSLVRRIMCDPESRRPEEAAILPVITKLLEDKEKPTFEVTFWGEPSDLIKTMVADDDINVVLRL